MILYTRNLNRIFKNKTLFNIMALYEVRPVDLLLMICIEMPKSSLSSIFSKK